MINNSKQKSYNNQIQFLIHLCIWGLIIHFLFAIDGLYYSFLDIIDPEIKIIDEAFILIPLLVGLFYLNYSYLGLKFLDRESWKKYSIYIALSFITYCFLSRGIFTLLSHKGFLFQDNIEGIFDFLPYTGIIILAVSTSIVVSKKMIQNDEIKEQAEKKQKEAEINYLTAQINPHFLFNSLNSIYSLAEEEKAKKSSDAILKLSEIMRYPIHEGAVKEVLISSEINFIKEYIDFQLIRIGYQYPIRLDISGDFTSKKIPPLLFISLIENSFKYGISQQQKLPIDINLTIKKNTLSFSVTNYVVKENIENLPKIGIENLKTRLKLLYPNNHTFIIKENNLFEVHITIELKSN